jgi:glucokinase
MAPGAHGCVLGVDVGGTKTALLLADVASGGEIVRDTFATPTGDGPDGFVTALIERARDLCARAGRQREDLRAAGLAVPGIVGRKGFVIEAGNLAGWHHIPLSAIVAKRFGIPVYVDQDANAAALGERWRGVAQAMNNFVFLAVGTGVGAGVVINGRLHRGYHQAAGEVGDFIFAADDLDRAHGEGGLSNEVGGAEIRGEARRISGGNGIGAREAIEAGLADAGRFTDLAARVVDHLALTVVNIALLVDPEAIVFGGGTGSSEELVDAVRERASPHLGEPPNLLVSALREDAQLHGAVFGALWQLDPSLALREELR